MEFVFNEKMLNLMQGDAVKERKQKEKELKALDEAIKRMGSESEDAQSFKEKSIKQTTGIIDLIDAMESGVEYNKKTLAKLLKKIMKNDKSLKKVYKKYRDKRFLDEDISTWKKGKILDLIERMGSTKTSTASGIDLSIEMAERKKNGGKKKGKSEEDKYKLGKHVAKKKRVAKNETDEEKFRRELEAAHSQSKVIIRDIIKESDEDAAEVASIIKDLKKARVTNKFRDLSTLYSVKSSIASTKLQASKEITNINKSIMDGSYKRVKDKKDKDVGSMTDSELFTDFFNNKLSNKITKSGSKSKGGKKGKKRSDSLDDAFDKKGLSLNDYDETIKFEGQWSPAIKSDYEENDWKFVAVDGANNIIKKFPKGLLPKKKLTALEFMDNDKARDKKSGVIYNVIKVKFL